MVTSLHILRVKFGVSQSFTESVLGPISFSLSMLPLGTIIHKHGVSFHSYADGTAVWFSKAK